MRLIGAVASAQFVGRGATKQLCALLAQLAALSDAVTKLRETQDRAVQAGAARRAAKGVRVTSAQRASVRPAPAGSNAGAAAPAHGQDRVSSELDQRLHCPGRLEHLAAAVPICSHNEHMTECADLQ